MKQSYSLTCNEIPSVAQAIASQLQGGEILALIGPLGSGKTAFVKALAKHLKIKNRVTSPTFILMHSFLGRLPKNKKTILLVHLDLYRTHSWKEIVPLGITELWRRKNSVTVIEWADKIKNRLPKNSQLLYFKHDQTL